MACHKIVALLIVMGLAVAVVGDVSDKTARSADLSARTMQGRAVSLDESGLSDLGNRKLLQTVLEDVDDTTIPDISDAQIVNHGDWDDDGWDDDWWGGWWDDK